MMRNSILLGMLLFVHVSSFAQYQRGLEPEGDVTELVQTKAILMREDYDKLPVRSTLKPFVPSPASQGSVGTCVAWSTGYYARTISFARREKLQTIDAITGSSFSPGYVYRMIEPNKLDCKGAYIYRALDLLKTKGVPLYARFPQNCTPSVPQNLHELAEPYRIQDYVLLFSGSDKDNYIKVDRVRKALAEKRPVVFGMHCPSSFNQAGERWYPTASDYTEAREIVVNGNYARYSGHAMCVVGYDDQKMGGAFEIVNSWGSNWGRGGFTWMTYDDFRRFTNNAYELVEAVAVEPPKPDPPKPDPVIPIPVDPVPAKIDLSGTMQFLDHTTGKAIAFNRITLDNRGIEVGDDDDDASVLHYQLQGLFEAGFKFRVQFSNDQPAYVYALGGDLTHQYNRLFPLNDKVSAYLDYSGNNIMLPGEKKFYRLDSVGNSTSFFNTGNAGSDFFCVLYAKRPLNLDRLIDALEAQPSDLSFSARLRKVLGNQLIPFHKINYANQRIAFKASSGDAYIVPLIIALKRR